MTLTALQPEPPAAPEDDLLCRMYGVLLDAQLRPTPFGSFTVRLRSTGVTGAVLLASRPSPVVADRRGIFQVDLLRGAQVYWSDPAGNPYNRAFTVPDVPVAAFFDFAMPYPIEVGWARDAETEWSTSAVVSAGTEVTLAPLVRWSDGTYGKMRRWRQDHLRLDLEDVAYSSAVNSVTITSPDSGDLEVPVGETTITWVDVGYESAGKLPLVPAAAHRLVLPAPFRIEVE